MPFNHAEIDANSPSLCEVLDRVLNKGVVVAGEIVISVADIDLIYVGMTLTLTSVDTANKLKSTPDSGNKK